MTIAYPTRHDDHAERVRRMLSKSEADDYYRELMDESRRMIIAEQDRPTRRFIGFLMPKHTKDR